MKSTAVEGVEATLSGRREGKCPMKFTPMVPALLLAACHSPETRNQINAMEANGEIESDASASPVAAPAAAAAVSIDRKNDLVDFHAGWPGEAAAIPALDKRFRAEAEKALAELVSGAKEDKAMRDKNGLEFHPFSGTTDYRVAGASDRLLSLDGVVEGYTGGAHGSHGSMAVLFDKVSGKDIGFDGLFSNPNVAFGAISKAWCAGLDKERKKRRPADWDSASDMGFNDCPKLDEIHVAPADKDGDHLFETLRIVADPYVAGPWAEGDYVVTLPVTPSMVAAFKPEYRASFRP